MTAGLYRDHMSFATIRRYLAAARKVNALLILDIQPGRGEFGPEITRLARFLREPDVGLALDPEWHVAPDALPGKVIGSTDADVVNAAATYLAKIVRERHLPEKLLIVHRFTDDMIARSHRLRQVPGAQTVINVDGFGFHQRQGRQVPLLRPHDAGDAPRLQVVLQGGRRDHVPRVGHGAPRRDLTWWSTSSRAHHSDR